MFFEQGGRVIAESRMQGVEFSWGGVVDPHFKDAGVCIGGKGW